MPTRKNEIVRLWLTTEPHLKRKMSVDYFIKNGHLNLFKRLIICVIAVFKIRECD